MQSMRHTLKPSIRPLLVMLLLVFLAAMTSMPQAKALASTEDTMLSINVKNSSIYTLTFDNNDGTEPTVTVDVQYYRVPKSVTPPTRDGYTFQGYFDSVTGGAQYYDANGVGIHVWDKESDATLYAHWAFQINCSIPTSADIEIDASGKSTTSTNPEFVSTSSADLRVAAITINQGANAASLFANNAVPDGVGIQLTPTSSGSSVRVPLVTSAVTTIPNNGWTIPAGSIETPTRFAVAFGLALPSGAQLNYQPDKPVTIANLSYVVAPG
ncbi:MULTISPECIES: InlB B-repeat-containing protein [Gordonibacter]|uniref:InlB B-repeat-containing protein n=1 Tax=Gordonibacter faecis TaxID=3047475 RepID=A0ABT7DI33_9ACTN|nr:MULTISPECIES: InlB B-repeat-containing protein [unclassified Gordonibacter]MDJ1649180.1 InlB B-repeat-containing protein [Gordonibacter sp. KGMB12511]HIW76184.1 InlB B-repeat-containing protein [Candidatus Gordonibacter avicola]